MTDIFGHDLKAPPTTQYSDQFEKLWKDEINRRKDKATLGNKKAAWKAGQKAEWTEENWAWLNEYLAKRHEEDVKWIAGVYVPHVSSIINQERWTDVYEKAKRHIDRYDNANKRQFAETHEEALKKIAEQQRKYEEAANARLH